MTENAGKTRFRFEGRRYASHRFAASGAHKFRLGERVRAARPLRNDGTYPHKCIGEILVPEGAQGFVIEIAKCCDGTYYTVGFLERAVVIEARSRDLKTFDDVTKSAPH
jgi:nitrogen fixation protein NifZ